MIEVRLRLTPTGHYFLGGERGFAFDSKLERQMSDSYFISSLKVPTQTTLFGALRYIIGVKNEALRENSGELIGNSSFDITADHETYGIIKRISPLYLCREEGNDCEYFIRTPFDHKIAEYDSGAEQSIRTANTYYTPMQINADSGCRVINYPGTETVKNYPSDYKAKDGISKSYVSLSDRRIVEEDAVFVSSVEVVSRKSKNRYSSENGFAKKEYVRLNKGWSFVFFARLDADEIPEYNSTVLLGKDSSLFSVEITPEAEPDAAEFFKDRPASFHYCQSPVYVAGDVPQLIDRCSFSIIENEYLRRFKTRNAKLAPEYDTPLLCLLSAGSVLYTDNIDQLRNNHAETAGFNKVIGGGTKK